MDMEEWFAVMGSAFDKFSLYAVPGEADRSGRDVIRLQTNALLLYKAAGMVAAGPAAKVAVRYVGIYERACVVAAYRVSCDAAMFSKR